MVASQTQKHTKEVTRTLSVSVFEQIIEYLSGSTVYQNMQYRHFNSYHPHHND